MGHVEVQSKITYETVNHVFALIQFAGGDFHCAIKEYSNESEYINLKNNLIKVFMINPLTEVIRSLDESFGKEYFTLKDIFIEERRKILQIMLKGKLKKFAQTYQNMYDEGKGSIYHMQNLGLAIPNEFKISATYAMSQKFNDLVIHSGGFVDPGVMQEACDINAEAKKMDIKLDKTESNEIYARKVQQNIIRLSKNFERQQAEVLLEIFDIIEKLELEIDISEAQNIYFSKIFHKIGYLIEDEREREFVSMLLEIGTKLNINTEFYKMKMLNLTK